MDQTRAVNALAPFVALASSANSPRAAADLIKQATSAPNAYVFAELLQQPNIQALDGHGQFGGYFMQLQIFAWGTWDTYKELKGLPELSGPQMLKLRLLSLLSIASEKFSSMEQQHRLTYASLCSRLDLATPIELEHLVTEAIYSNLISATLNPENQTVVITSIAPLRDLAPGSVRAMISELAAWSERCEGVLSDLETEIARVKLAAARRHAREARAEKQIKAALDGEGKDNKTVGSSGERKGSRNVGKREPDDEEYDEDDMDIDGGGAAASLAGGGKKRLGNLKGMFKR